MMRILIVASDRAIRNSLKEKLEYERCVVDTVESAEELTSQIEKTRYKVIFYDTDVPYKGGAMALIGEVKKLSPTTDIIVLSDVNSVQQAVSCMKAGAYDYINKPIDLSKLLGSIRELREGVGQGPETGKIPAAARPVAQKVRSDSFYEIELEEMIGETECMLQIKSLIDKVAPSDARILITGSNGTGKELVARWLHAKSKRAGKPFVEVNCAAIPSELIESELFGHEKGAFTSAIKQRKGKFEQADGGTLFLDEIGDMSLSAQSKMLRALQEKKICRVGSDNDINVDVRIVAATNKNLLEEIISHNFREDLYHRLSVILVRVPSLCERREDIPLLVEYFLDKICRENEECRKEIEPDCVEALMNMEWPGNIRQLRNVMERLIILSGKTITLEDVNMYALNAW